MHSLEINPKLRKKLSKLLCSNRKQYEMVMRKAQEIVLNPLHYKNLRAPLQHLKEVHIDRHFVLTFSVEGNTVILKNFCHHKEIFRD